MNCAKFATDPLTSQSTTSSVRCGRLGRWWVTIRTPPVRSTPGRYAGSPAGHVASRGAPGQPGREPSRQRVDLAPHLLEVRAAGRSEVEPVDGGPHGHVRDVVGALLLRDPAARVGLDHPREGADAAAGLAARLVVGAPSASSAETMRSTSSAARPVGARCTPTTRTAPVRGPASPRTGRPSRPPAPAAPAGRPRTGASSSSARKAVSASALSAHPLLVVLVAPPRHRHRPAAGSRGRRARRRSAAATAS